MKAKRNLIQICLLGAMLWAVTTRADFTYTTLNSQVIITGYSGTAPNALVIPDTISGLPVISIGLNAFYNFTNLISVTISTNVTSIGDEAFYNCDSLTSLTIPNNVTSIGYATFADCIDLTSITIGNGVTNIGQAAFAGCYYLTGITIGNGISTIGDDAFGENPTLRVIYFRGNTPLGTNELFDYGNSPVFIYHQLGTTGWSTNGFEGMPTSPYFLVVNGGFEDTGDFFGWTVSGTGSSYISGAWGMGMSTAVFTDTASKPGVHGTVPGTSSVLSQTLPTQAGASYVLSFTINGLTNGDCNVVWNGSTLINQQFSPGWTNLQFIVTATTTNTVLQFTFPPRFQLVATTAIDNITVTPLPQLTAQLVGGGKINLSSFVGIINANYALDRTFSLAPPVTWTPQGTNATDGSGMLTLTNTPVTTTNNFWRIRSTP